jgi:GTP-binding protein HflX
MTIAIILTPILKKKSLIADSSARLEEAVGLACAVDLKIIHKEVLSLSEIKASTYIGKGNIERLKELIDNGEDDVELVIIDCHLTPIQQRNLEKLFERKVIDRTALILEIFGKRAQTKEGKLQVELAHLNYQKSRLVRSWTHLERQRGGYGFLGGPGESQIELDRRLIGGRIKELGKQLEKVKKTRALHRSARSRVPYAIVALVGYTNAGKSTLFNKLTKANVISKDMLFATLDPTMREVVLPSKKRIILSDTVGFISDLPTELVAAFRATLEEVQNADLILHVRDISHTDTKEQKKSVEEILIDLGLEKKMKESKVLNILNKADLLSPQEKKNLGDGNNSTLFISALTGEGIDYLLQTIDAILSKDEILMDVTLSLNDGKKKAWLYQNTSILKENVDIEKHVITIQLKASKNLLKRIESLCAKNMKILL